MDRLKAGAVLKIQFRLKAAVDTNLRKRPFAALSA